ncbi:MAG: NAD-dependent DNA ligase LigA, partial [Patescibacteria group bacterium]
MNKQEAKKRLEKLRRVIDHHRYLYHVLDQQEISESALDSLKKELYDLEQIYPDLITANSPTQRVAGKPLAKFKKVSHQ